MPLNPNGCTISLVGEYKVPASFYQRVFLAAYVSGLVRRGALVSKYVIVFVLVCGARQVKLKDICVFT